MSIVDKLVEGGHLTPEQVERIGESVHEFLKEADANPAVVDEYMDKVALSPIMKHMGMMAGAGLAASAAGGLAALGIGAARDWINDVSKAKRYKAMLEANPELRSRGVNSKMVQMHFNTLNRFNPDYAKDPLVSGAYVMNQLEAARPNIESLNNIVQARKNISEVGRHDPLKTLPGQFASRVTEQVSKIPPPAPPPTDTERHKALRDFYATQAGLQRDFEDVSTPRSVTPAQAEMMKKYAPIAEAAEREARGVKKK